MILRRRLRPTLVPLPVVEGPYRPVRGREVRSATPCDNITDQEPGHRGVMLAFELHISFEVGR